MLLKDSLFTLIESRVENNHAEVDVRLDVSHPIYSGHFPDDPITPGVCVVQMAVELCSMLLVKKLELKGSKSIKFINIIRPNIHPQVTYVLDWTETEDGVYHVKMMVRSEDVVFAKCSLQLSDHIKQ